MCYRCEVCQEQSNPKKQEFKYPLYKYPDPLNLAVKQIEREMKVCETCNIMLVSGIPLAAVIRQRGKPAKARTEVARVPVVLHHPLPVGPRRQVGRPIPLRASTIGTTLKGVPIKFGKR